MTVFVQVTSIILDVIQGNIAPIGFALWTWWQLYCPLPQHTTKLEDWFGDIDERLNSLELAIVAVARELDAINADQIEDFLSDEDEDTADDVLTKTDHLS